MSNPFNEDFRWGMFGGLFASLLIVVIVTCIYKIGVLMTYDNIINQCDGRYREFQIYGKYYTCQAKP